MEDTRHHLRSGIPKDAYERIDREIESTDSPVGIDARKTHVLILYKLEQMEERMRALEAAGAGGGRGDGKEQSTDGLRSRAEEIARLLDRASFAERAWPEALALGTDVVDEEIRRLQDAGVDVEERVAAVRKLILRTTDPAVMEALGSLADAAPALVRMARTVEALPDVAAIGVDVFDDAYRDFEARGIDPESAVRRGLETVLRLARLVSATNLEDIESLFASTILEPGTLRMISRMGEALVETGRTPPPRVGILGLLAASREPEIQRAAGFLVQFARHLGAGLEQPPPDSRNLPTTSAALPGATPSDSGEEETTR